MPTDVERLTVLIEANTKSYENAMKRLQQQTTKAINASNRSVKSLDSQLKVMSATAQRAAGLLGITLGAGALVHLVKGAVEAGSKVGDLANQLGITAEQVQEFSFAAAQSGSSQEGFVRSVTAMNRAIGDLQRGSVEAKREFAALGITLSDLAGKNPGEAFELILDRINKLSNPLQRNAALMKIFGKSGVELAEMASLGADGIDKLKSQARELGLVLSNEEIAKLKDAGDKIDIIGQAGQTAGERMAIAFLPAIDAIAKLVTSPEFQQGLADTAEKIGGIVKFLAEHPGLAKFLAGAAAGGFVGGPVGALVGGVVASAPSLEDITARMNANRGTPAPAHPPLDLTVYGGNKGKAAPATGSGFGTFTDPAVDQQRKRYEALAASLALAQTNLTATDREQEIANSLAKLGTEATEKQRASIELLAGQYYDQKKALAEFNEQAQFFGSTIEDALEGLIVRGEDAGDVLKNLVSSLASAVIQAELLGQGPLAGLLGTSPTGGNAVGGILGALFGGLSGRAGGGSVMARTPYMVGERGPELFIPNTSGRIANDNNQGGGLTLVNNVDARGSTMTEAQFKAVLAENNRAIIARLPDHVANIARNPRRRGTG